MIAYINRQGNIYYSTAPDTTGDLVATAAELAAWIAPRIEASKRAEIEAAYNAAVSFLKDYPQSEQMSWGAQEAEAIAFTANNAAATPTLSAIAARTGETVTVLAGKVIANANAFKAGGGDAIGRRRARMKAIDAAVAANNMAALQAVVW